MKQRCVGAGAALFWAGAKEWDNSDSIYWWWTTVLNLTNFSYVSYGSYLLNRDFMTKKCFNCAFLKPQKKGGGFATLGWSSANRAIWFYTNCVSIPTIFAWLFSPIEYGNVTFQAFHISSGFFAQRSVFHTTSFRFANQSRTEMITSPPVGVAGTML